MALAPRLTSRRGGEFLKELGTPVAQLQFSHYFHRFNFSQGNGPIERSFRTEEEEFYPVEDLPASLEEHLRDDAYHQA